MSQTNSDILTATRNGVSRTFTRRMWDIMGTDKYGWVLEPEVPKEVAELVADKPKQTRKPKEDAD